jgi:hypothetical protein
MPSTASRGVFRTAGFSKDAKKAHIGDSALCAAMRQVMAGQADDLGGGVFKKRLSDNQYRSIVLAKGGRYEALTEPQVADLISARQFVEICHDDEA